MRSRTRQVTTALIAAALGAALTATPARAEDTTTTSDPAAVVPAAAPVIAATTSTTLPLFGVALTIDVATGPDGSLASITLNPADGFTETNSKPNRVAFVNDAGTAKVVVKTRDGGQRVEAKAGSLEAVSGAGIWSGDVFDTGTTTTVNFTIGTLDGGPDVSGVTVNDPTAVVGATEYSTDEDDHGDDDGDETKRVAKVRIKFVNGIQARYLTIKAELKTDDGETRAKVQVSLSKLKALEVDAAVATGPQFWQAMLCDGSEARIDYVVSPEGTVSNVVVSHPDAQVEAGDEKITVRFATGERVTIKVHSSDGQRKIKVDVKIRCDKDHDDDGDDDGDHDDDDDDDDEDDEDDEHKSDKKDKNDDEHDSDSDSDDRD